MTFQQQWGQAAAEARAYARSRQGEKLVESLDRLNLVVLHRQTFEEIVAALQQADNLQALHQTYLDTWNRILDLVAARLAEFLRHLKVAGPESPSRVGQPESRPSIQHPALLPGRIVIRFNTASADPRAQDIFEASLLALQEALVPLNITVDWFNLPLGDAAQLFIVETPPQEETAL